MVEEGLVLEMDIIEDRHRKELVAQKEAVTQEVTQDVTQQIIR